MTYKIPSKSVLIKFQEHGFLARKVKILLKENVWNIENVIWAFLARFFPLSLISKLIYLYL